MVKSKFQNIIKRRSSKLLSSILLLIALSPTVAFASNPVLDLGNSIWNTYMTRIIEPLSNVIESIFYIPIHVTTLDINHVSPRPTNSKKSVSIPPSLVSSQKTVYVTGSSPVTYVTNTYPTTTVYQSGGGSGGSFDASQFVSKKLFDIQILTVLDSASNKVTDLADRLYERTDTKTLSVVGDATVGGDLTITGNIIGTVVGTINPSFTLGSVPFQGTSGLEEDNTNLFWDNATNRLGIGTNTPATALHVVGDITIDGSVILPALASGVTPTSKYVKLPTGESMLILRDDPTYYTSGLITGLDIFLGRNAGNLTATGGGNNIALGDAALNALTSGYGNIAIGMKSSLVTTNGNYNVAVGLSALGNNTASGIVGVGYQALGGNTSGGFNTAIGNSALAGNTTGSYNTAVGADAQRNTTTSPTGSYNVSVGGASLRYMTSGSSNTGIGYHVGHSTSSGSNNSYLGYLAGENNTTGNRNIFIGSYGGWYSGTASDQVFINSIDRGSYAGDQNGSPIYIQQNATVGNQLITLNGMVGINTTNPYANFTNYNANVYDSSGFGLLTTLDSLSWSSSGAGYVAAIENRDSNTTVRNGLLVKTAATDTASYIARFESGGSNRLSIRADGNVGIGTTSPATKLQIIGTNALRLGTVSDYYSFYQSNTNVWTWGSPSFNTMTWDGANNRVGINNTTPGYTLDVNGTLSVMNGTNGGLRIGVAAGSPQFISGTTSIAFNNNANNTQLMTLLNGGNLGIGPTSPTAVLHLKAGTATANTAPLKLTSGTNLTAVEAGAFEYDGTDLFFSPSTVRNTLVRNNTTHATVNYGLFIGDNAGLNATSSTQSNFIGRQAGQGATSANNSNFLGPSAGFGATGANTSNFLGPSAGNGASGANNSNFFGSSAGLNATGAANSNFFGNSSGNTAGSATQSNFFGNSAGYQATSAANSNFFGNNAGRSAASANNSNFFGRQAGQNTASGSFSNFFGFNTGSQFTGNDVGANNIIIGTNISLPNATANAINIGGVLFGTGTYATTSGNPSIAPTASGKIGIAQAAPAFTLHVGSSLITDGTTLLRLEDANSTCDFNANSGAPTCGSDRTLKKDIASLSTADLLTKISALNPVSYHWLAEGSTSPLQYGFIAQEVAEQFPDLVTDHLWIDGTQKKFLSMGGLMPYAIGALKELNLKVNGLSSLDTTNSNSLGSLVKQFLADISNGIENLFAKRIHTEELCVKKGDGSDICITGDQLEQLLGGQTTFSGSGGNGDTDTGDAQNGNTGNTDGSLESTDSNTTDTSSTEDTTGSSSDDTGGQEALPSGGEQGQ